MNWKGILLTLIILLIIIWAVFLNNSSTEPELTGEPIKIGAILPLSGVTAIWGEDAQKGIEWAVRDLAPEGSVEVIIEDSGGQATEGLSAYSKLVHTDGVDVVISLFSRVSVPLASLAQEDQVPLVMTLVAAEDVTKDNPYAFRVFHEANQTGGVHFYVYDKEGYDKLAILYLNDEFGSSVYQVMKEQAEEKGIEVIGGSYLPEETDYRTQLTKIKSEEPDALSFIGIPPTALSNMLKQANELDLDIPVFEPSGILQSPATRDALGELVDGTFSIATTFDVQETGAEFYDKYSEMFGQAPSFSVSYAYDVTKFILENVSEEGWVGGEAFVDSALKLERFEGLNGEYKLNGDGEINPFLRTARFIDGDFIIVE